MKTDHESPLNNPVFKFFNDDFPGTRYHEVTNIRVDEILGEKRPGISVTTTNARDKEEILWHDFSGFVFERLSGNNFKVNLHYRVFKPKGQVICVRMLDVVWNTLVQFNREFYRENTELKQQFPVHYDCADYKVNSVYYNQNPEWDACEGEWCPMSSPYEVLRTLHFFVTEINGFFTKVLSSIKSWLSDGKFSQESCDTVNGFLAFKRLPELFAKKTYSETALEPMHSNWFQKT